MPTKYCESCDENKGCENYHAYIIELRREVLDEKGDFPYEGVLPDDKRVFYVGETTHSVECRFVEHTTERPSNNLHYCTCSVLGTNPNHKKMNRKLRLTAKMAKDDLKPTFCLRILDTIYCYDQNM